MSTGNILSEDFINRLSAVIDQSGLTKAAFAEKIGVSPGFITNISKGRSTPSKKTMILISELFNVNLEWLESGKGQMRSGMPGVKYTEDISRAALDRSLMRTVIEAVELCLDESSKKLAVEKKSELIIILYDIFMRDHRFDKETVTRMIQFAA